MSPEKVKSQPTSKEAYVSAMDVPLQQISDKFGCISLNEQHLQVKEWPTLNNFNFLHDAQKCFDASYDPNI